MGLLDTITGLANVTLPVTRRSAGTYDASGLWQASGVTTTFSIIAVMEPANGIARIVGGRDQITDEQGEKVFDVRVIWTATELLTRTQTTDPDIIAYDGSNWKVFRAEKWDLNGQVHWKLALTRLVQGAS